MNTSKQINIMVALVFLAVLATGAYTMWDPSRESDARKDELNKTVQRGAFLFAQNCVVCHGNSGEGGAKSNRLKTAPPLNRTDLQGKDASTGAVSATDKAQQFKFVVNTITCGRIGKSMPTWGQSQGGTLNDEQIRQLATMITEGTGWEQAAEFAVNGDEAHHYTGYASAGIKLVQALDASSTTVYVTNVDPIGKGSRLQVDDELMLVTSNPNKDQKSVEVERGLGTTSPAAHEAGALVPLPPVPPDPPPVTQPACGQNLPAAVPTTGPAAPSTNLTVVGQGIAFDVTALTGVAGQELTITFDNRDAGIPHNFHVYKGEDATGESVGQTEIVAGAVTQTLKIGPLDPGKYFYQCDVHPGQMEGLLTVVEAGAASVPAGATTETAATPAASPAP